MTPIERARELYPDPSRFAHDVLTHIMHGGHVLATRDALVMGFRCHAADVERGEPMSIHDAREDGDCWFVWLAAGKLAEVLKLIPFPLPHVAFARMGRLRIWSLAELTRHGRANV